MRDRFLNLAATGAITATVGAVAALLCAQTSAQGPKSSASMLKTPWAEPDLQGIWTNEFDTPLQRPAKYADQEFFTEAERAELDKQRSETLADQRPEHGTEADVAGADNSVGKIRRRTGKRTSLIADPPNGQIPPMTPEAQKAAAADREFALALLQATETCKSQRVQCQGGKYDPTPSLRRSERPPRSQRGGRRGSIRVHSTTLQSPRWAGGRFAGRPLSDGWAAGAWAAKFVRCDLLANRADARRRLDVL
jgi:hypothetical protein